MFLKYGLPLLAIGGFGVALLAIAQGGKQPAPPPAASTPASPYASSVVGIGVVEPNTESIAISAPVAGVVTKVFVKLGDDVAAGTPLFTLDDRAIRADLAVRQAALAVRQAALPVARTGASDAKYQFGVANQLVATSAGPEQDRETRRYAMEKANTQVAQAEADVKAAETDLKAAEIELDRLTVRSPIDGRILQLKLHTGEFAPQSAAVPPLVLGNVTPMFVRVEIDEYEAPRVKSGASGTGFLRGDPATKIPLRFVRFEPVVVPKKTLTGDAVERTDTRVLQVILAIDSSAATLFVGQQMDVFLDASPRN